MLVAKTSTLTSFLFSLMFCLPVLAQSRVGEASGTVTDSSGAVVRGATVILKNQGTNIQNHATESRADSSARTRNRSALKTSS